MPKQKKHNHRSHLRLVDPAQRELERRLALELANREDDGGDEGGDSGSVFKPDFREALGDLNKQEQLLAEQTAGHSKLGAVIPHTPKSDINDLNQSLGDGYQESAHPLLSRTQRLDGIGIEDTTVNPSPSENPLAYSELQQELQKQYQKRLERQLGISKSVAENMNLRR